MYFPSGKLSFDTEAKEWHWQGGSVACIYLSDLSHAGLALSTSLQLGPYRVRPIRTPDVFNALVWVTHDDWAAPFWITLDRLYRSLEIIKCCIIRLACIWGLGNTPEGARYEWRCIYVIGKLIDYYNWVRHLAYEYKLKGWLYKTWAQVRDLSVRPWGDRFLSVAKDDDDCTVYLNGSEEPEMHAFEARVPKMPGAWGKGWIHVDEVRDGKIQIENGRILTHRIHGLVMWRNADS